MWWNAQNEIETPPMVIKLCPKTEVRLVPLILSSSPLNLKRFTALFPHNALSLPSRNMA